jgi:hypothetical protein
MSRCISAAQMKLSKTLGNLFLGRLFVNGLSALAILAASHTSSAAIIVAGGGSDLEIGASWRTQSVAKTDPANTSNALGNVLGQDGYWVVGANQRIVMPSYISSWSTNSVYPGNLNYASIDDPSTTPGGSPTTLVSGIVSPVNGSSFVGQYQPDLGFTVNSSVPREFQVAVLVDNLDLAAFNAASISLWNFGGPDNPGGVSAAPYLASVATTSAAYNDRVPDLIYFTVTGAQAGDEFYVGGLAGANADAAAAVFAFDTVVPEPASIVALAGLCGMGLIGVVLRRRRAPRPPREACG